MKKLRKGANCLNCGLALDKKYNYCPQCGQENTNNKASVRVLVWDTVLSYFSFDMMFGRSLLPFLFKPGYLTTAFLEGSRVGHIHPVRLYLLTNFLFFLIFTKTIDLRNVENTLSLDNQDNKPQLVTTAFIYNENDTTKLSLKELADSLGIDRKGIKKDSLAHFLVQEIKNRKIPIKYELKNEQKDDIISINNLGINNEGKGESFSWQKMVRNVRRKDLSPSNFLDSIGWKTKSPRALKTAEQAMKIGRNDLSMFILNAINNIPLMMILMLPLIAFYLKIFYMFSKRLYIEHLIFTFHFQSFAYFIHGIFLLLFSLSKEAPQDTMGTATICLFFVWLLHTYVAFKKVYKQSWWFTAFKIFWLSIFYITTLILFLIGEMTYSFFTY
ncbi:MAG: DUF3667 domain-containing protein [Cytophagales bacterium]|nr:MAG: DUF3667 domain-containing protein [Cytophagales bacterium]